MTAPDKSKAEVYRDDLPRINALAAQLSADGPGRFRQAETIRWLLDQREALAELAERAAHLIGTENPS